MLKSSVKKFDVIIIGGGLSGLVTAYELLDRGKKILLIEKDKKENFGGLAKESFGGIHLIDSPHQRKMKIYDSPELAFQDWERVAKFNSQDLWPRKWAQFYCEHSIPYIFDFLKQKKIRFLPVVNWLERGMSSPGNRLPRWHVVWGTGYEIIFRLLNALSCHKNFHYLTIWYEHEAFDFETQNTEVTGVRVKDMKSGEIFSVFAEHVVIAAGGICGGDLSKLKQNWVKEWGTPPEVILNGAHIYGDGLLHDKTKELGGNITYLDRQWLYPSGIHHPAKRKPHDGLSLVPPRSALWINAQGERIGPPPLVGATDTRYIVESILKQPGQYSWQILNWKIAIKELGVSGCGYMDAFRYKKKLLLLKQLLFGNPKLVRRLAQECPEDIVVANSLPELVTQMDMKGRDGYRIDFEKLEGAIREYDDQIAQGKAYFSDDQLRCLIHFRAYRGDRLRLCNFQKILDQRAMPLIAIRQFILARKSLGGIQTDLQCRVLRENNNIPISGLYAIGEAAGFGGGGIHGMGSLEGTFLGSCILTGRLAAKSITEN